MPAASVAYHFVFARSVRPEPLMDGPTWRTNGGVGCLACLNRRPVRGAARFQVYEHLIDDTHGRNPSR